MTRRRNILDEIERHEAEAARLERKAADLRAEAIRIRKDGKDAIADAIDILADSGMDDEDLEKVRAALIEMEAEALKNALH